MICSKELCWYLKDENKDEKAINYQFDSAYQFSFVWSAARNLFQLYDERLLL